METTGTVTPSPDFFCLLALLLFLSFEKQQSWLISWGLSSRFAAAALQPGTAFHSVPEMPGPSKAPPVSWLPNSQTQVREPKNWCLHVAPSPLLRRGEVLWHPVGAEAPRAPGPCVIAWEVSKKGICQLYGQGTWNLGISNHQLGWRADTPVPCMFYKHRVNLCGGHHQPEISPTPVKNLIWSLISQIRSVPVEVRFMKNCSLRQSLLSL